ncbi:MAG: cation transporter [Coriobacteriaceae bacterium]|nr:cation transporter [Coriobacteriaceae bacterium]
MAIMHSRNPEVFDRVHQIRRVLLIILLLNVSVALAKLIYGLITSSISMQADGVHSFFDGAGNIVGLIGMAVACRPADAGHPYGHGKFETIASVIIGLILLTTAVNVGREAVVTLMSGTSTAQVTWLSFVVMIATLCINVGVTLYERRAGKRLNSEILIADASHTLSDALVSVGVIVGLVFVSVGITAADGVIALAVSMVILYTAWTIFRQAAVTLSDKARLPLKEVMKIACSNPGVSECHRIRTRGMPGEVYVDFHILVDAQMSVQEAHGIADDIESALKSEYPAIADIVIHIEPDTDEQRQEDSTFTGDFETSGSRADSQGEDDDVR